MPLTNNDGIMKPFAVAGTARGAMNYTAITAWAGTAQRAVPAAWFVKGIIPFSRKNFPIKKF
jgi:hypothetical protein